MNMGWLADEFCKLEALEHKVTKVILPAPDAQISEQMTDKKTVWGARVIIRPEMGRKIALAYVRFDDKKFKRTIPLP